MDFRQYLKEEIDQDFRLLKQYENQRRGESDPGRKYRLEQDIQEVKNRIRERESELKSLPTDAQNNDLDIDVLVQEVRKHHSDKIQSQCGTIRIFDVAYPIDLRSLFVQVNLLDRPSSFVRVDLTRLPNVLNIETDEVDRFSLGKVEQARLSGLDVAQEYSKLMVLGKPGAGKSTFLQYLAIQCNQGNFCPDKVPIFIRLRDFAGQKLRSGTLDLPNYLQQEFSEYEISDQFLVNRLLNTGKLLFLFDGLDEVEEGYTSQIIDEIRLFSEKYYKNNYIITCRNATQQHQLRYFRDVEVADFDQIQIENFARKWFFAVGRRCKDEADRISTQFIETLNLPGNSQIRELAVTPILLILTCLVFQSSLEFPVNRISLYKEGLDILLQKWDEVRGIQRDRIYQDLSLKQKLNLLIHLASITFEKKSYFFRQDEICQYIANYLPILLGSKHNLASSQRDSKDILRAIELQHGLLIERAQGIYSFSHLTFQEYLTAQRFTEAIFIGDTSSLEKLFSYSSSVNWKEVFSLVKETIQSSSKLQKFVEVVNKFILNESEIQQLLSNIKERSILVELPYRKLVLRAFYFSLTFSSWHDSTFHDFGLFGYLDSDLKEKLDRDLYFCRGHRGDFKPELDLLIALDLALVRAQKGLCNLLFALDYTNYFNPVLTRDLENLRTGRKKIDEYAAKLKCPGDSSLERLTPEKKSHLINMQKSHLINMEESWNKEFMVWVQKLETHFAQHQRIVNQVKVSSQQKEKIKRYYDMNLFLVMCLESSRLSSIDIQTIENMILTPSLGNSQ